MGVIGYTAVDKFGPADGDRWKEYIAWSGLHQLSRVITTDGSLCPNVFDKITDEDWKHNIQQNFLIGYFRDFDYLLARIPAGTDPQILGFVHQPTDSFPHGFFDSRFEFVGYDLVEKSGSISALLNCGGFPESFSNAELNESGLITTFERAEKIQSELLKNNPDEFHASCDIRALWLYVGY